MVARWEEARGGAPWLVFAETAGLATADREGLGYEQLGLRPVNFSGDGWVAYYDPTWCD